MFEVDRTISEKYPEVLTLEQWKDKMVEEKRFTIEGNDRYSNTYHRLFMVIRHGTQELVDSVLEEIEELTK